MALALLALSVLSAAAPGRPQHAAATQHSSSQHAARRRLLGLGVAEGLGLAEGLAEGPRGRRPEACSAAGMAGGQGRLAGHRRLRHGSGRQAAGRAAIRAIAATGSLRTERRGT